MAGRICPASPPAPATIRGFVPQRGSAGIGSTPPQGVSESRDRVFEAGTRNGGREFLEETVAAFASFEEIFGPQRASDTLFRARSGVDRVVNEPSAVVVPKMVIGVFSTNTDFVERGVDASAGS